LDLLPIGEGSFLPPRKQNQKDFKQSNPQTENAQIIQTPHRKKTVDKPSVIKGGRGYPTAVEKRPHPTSLSQQQEGGRNLRQTYHRKGAALY
jgi:hypothetical protein